MAVTATALFPKEILAAAQSKELSTPPEKATNTLSFFLRLARSPLNFDLSSSTFNSKLKASSSYEALFKMLTKEEVERYSRQIALRDIGIDGQRRLKEARICVVGVGGLGCVSALQATAMGVGHIRLVDRDVVDLTNLQRQILYDVKSIGRPKVEVAAEKLRSINPNIEVEPVPLSIDFRNAKEIVKDVDVVLDGLDRFATRLAVNNACVEAGVSYVFGAALEAYGNVSTIIPGKTACLECIFPRMNDEALPSCEAVGVTPSILSVIASIEMQEAVSLILGKEPPLANRLLFCDLRSMEFEAFPLRRRGACRACGASPRLPKPDVKKIVELCGKDSFIIVSAEEAHLDMDRVAEVLSRSFRVRIRSRFGVTFDYTDDVSISLMVTGNTLIKGAKGRDVAVQVHDEVMRMVS